MPVECDAEPGAGGAVRIGAEVREKWKEVPAGTSQGGRLFSANLLHLDDAAFLAYWCRQFDAGCRLDDRGWYQTLYRAAFAGRNVLEIGSGLGFDGVYFLQHGARWTFADIVEDNLRVVERACRLLGLGERAQFLFIADFASFDRLPRDFDVIWCNGSMHHVPFATARAECQQILPHLRPRGRWIELSYPYERWVREGSKPFSQWGQMTDGEKTPWAEWYNVEKLRQRLFPARFATVLNFNLPGDSMNWMDLMLDSDEPFEPACFTDLRADQAIDLLAGGFTGHNEAVLTAKRHGLTICTTPRIWDFAASVKLPALLADLIPEPWRGRLRAAIDIECTVTRGALGFAVCEPNLQTFLGHEKMLDARPEQQRLTVTIDSPEQAHALVVRNTHGQGASQATIHKATLRVAA